MVGERGQYQVTRPIQTIQVPPIVQTMLAARIDRLASEDKRLLQTAAVVGKDVPWALLLAIAGESEDNLRRGLDRLQAAEFLYQTGLFPELEYSFKHALTHEVTYNGLLRERRRDLHAHIVAAIESFQDDRREAEIDRLAEHALRGELSEKAVYYLRQAGFRAIKRSAFKEAVARFDQALDILDSLPDSQSNLEQAFDIRLDLRPVLNPLGETRKSLERTREAEQIAERLDDNHRRGRVCCFITNSHSLAGDLDEALLSGTRALKLADQLNDLRLKIPTTTHLEQAHYWRGDDERVIELASNNLAALPSEWGESATRAGNLAARQCMRQDVARIPACGRCTQGVQGLLARERSSSCLAREERYHRCTDPTVGAYSCQYWPGAYNRF